MIDITTFTHEQLLILLKYLNYLKGRGETAVTVEIAYNGARKYSTNTPANKMWLSKGVLEIRPVLGYSGNFTIGKPVQLIMLVGYEHERAKAVFEHIEPSAIALGLGHKQQSISPELADTNKYFFDELSNFVKGVGATHCDVHNFEFSAVDPHATAAQLLTLAQFDTHNVIVCPLNTKISTFGVALAVFERPEIQVVYAEPQSYNEAGYSTPDDQIRYARIWQ